MRAREFLEVAEDLVTELCEGEWRSAISRAYYAAFHVAWHLLRQCSFVVPNGDRAHAYLWLRLANCGYSPLQRTGNDLSSLRGQRNQADYDLDPPIEQRFAQKQVVLAAEIINMLDQAAAMPTVLTQITDAIRTYERDVLKEVTWQP